MIDRDAAHRANLPPKIPRGSRVQHDAGCVGTVVETRAAEWIRVRWELSTNGSPLLQDGWYTVGTQIKLAP